MTNRTRLVLSLLVTPFLLIVLLLVTAPDANHIAAQFATATPCATQPQIAPTFDTGNEPAVTLTPYGTDDPCAPPIAATAQAINNAPMNQPTSVANSCTTDKPSPFNYTNFDNVSSLCFFGTATQIGSTSAVARLTAQASGQNGSVWHKTKQPVAGSWDTWFTFKVQPKFTENGANGFAFVIHNDARGVNALGSYAGGLGYDEFGSGNAFIKDSLALMFYTHPWGEGDNYVALRTVGQFRPTQRLAYNTNLPYAIDDNVAHQVHVSYRGSILTVRTLHNGTWVQLLQVNNFNIATALNTRSAFVGFTGATGNDGNIVNTHDILNWRMTSSAPVCNINAVDTIGAFDPATNRFYLRNSNSTGQQDVSIEFGTGASGLLPITGDWNGDGVDTVGIYNPASKFFFLRDSNDPNVYTYQSFQYAPAGSGTLTPLAGDWDGDGIDTIGIYKLEDSRFYLRDSNSTGPANYSPEYGLDIAPRVPLVGDWDGDGKDSIGLYGRVGSQNAQFYLNNLIASTAASLKYEYQPNLPSTTKQFAGDWETGNGCIQKPGRYKPYASSSDPSQVYLYKSGSGSGGAYTTMSAINAVPPFSYPTNLTSSGLIPVAGVWQGVETCLWGGTRRIGSTDCDFIYRPNEAANYAIKYSLNRCPFFCGYNYVSSGNECSPGTDCASFVSQALVAGGVPLTNDLAAANATPTPQPAYIKRWYCEKFSTRPCEKQTGVYTWTGATFKNNGTYFSLGDYLVIVSASRALVVNATQVAGLSQPHPDPFPIVTLTPAEILQRKNNAENIGRTLYDQYKMGVGDVIAMNKTDKEHIVIIVRWGPAVSTWGELNGLYEEHQEDLSKLPIVPDYAKNYVVPYIVDHGTQGENLLRFYPNYNVYPKALITGPRPYYALTWQIPLANGGGVTGSNEDSPFNASNYWHFIRVYGEPEPAFQNAKTFSVPAAHLKSEGVAGFSIPTLEAMCTW